MATSRDPQGISLLPLGLRPRLGLLGVYVGGPPGEGGERKVLDFFPWGYGPVLDISGALSLFPAGEIPTPALIARVY